MLPLSTEMVDMLKKLSAACKIKDLTGKPYGYIFTMPHGRPYRTDSLNRIWQRAVKRAGEPPCNFYNATRHSKASQLANDYPIQKVQAWMGHSSYQTTDAHYVQRGFLELKEMVDGK